MKSGCVYCLGPIDPEEGPFHEDCYRCGRLLDEDVHEARRQVANDLQRQTGSLDGRLWTAILGELIEIRVILGRGERGG